MAKIERKATTATQDAERAHIEVLRMTPYNGNRDSSLLAFVTVRVDRVVISDCRLMVSKDGNAFVNMPSEKGADGNYYNKVWFDCGTKDANKALYAEIAEVVKQYYEENA